jgi:hypothetical protein
VDRHAGHSRYLQHREQKKVALAILAAALTALLAACGGGSSAGAGSPPPPAFTNVNAPGAGTTSLEGTFGEGIDAQGDIAGYFIDANGIFHGFRRNSGGTIATVDAPGAALTQNSGTFIRAMNASGQATGYYSDRQGFLHSFLLSPQGTLTEFDPPNSNGSTGLSINDDGAVAGAVIDANGDHGFVRAAGGTFTLFDPTGNPAQVQAIYPYGININGAIAGMYTDTNGVYHGFLRDASGTLTILDVPGAGTLMNEGTEPDSMNSQGVIVGGINVGVINGVNTTHSFIRAADGTYTVFDPPQSPSSFAESINDTGVVLGEYRDENLVRHGYLRSADGSITSFDDPEAAQLPLSSTNMGTTPQSINENGAVTGLYSDANGVRHAFIMQ